MALGNFDGFHRGHQAVVGQAAALAAALAAPLAVLSFEPHPVRFFRPDLPPFQLTSTAQKVRLLEGFGVDSVIILPFDAALASLTPEAFVAEILIGRLAVRHVVCGHDFTFGKGRAGHATDLARLGVPATVVAPVSPPGQGGAFASSAIRQLLAKGDPEAAARQLGRWWQIEGEVEAGDQRGRTIGFPTANLSLGTYQRPAYGVYAVRAGVDGRVVDGVANLGVRPSFDPPRELFEVHLLDFAGDLYGRTLAVDLLAFIRPERRFDGLDALRKQIEADRLTAQKILRQPAFAAGRFPPATRADFIS